MSFIRIKFTVLLCSLLFAAASFAQTQASPADAQALVKKAVAFLAANGKEGALREFNYAKGQFVKGDLYIFVIDKDGTTLANGVNPRIVNKNVKDMKDKTGKAFIKDMLEMSATKNDGWVEYQWPDPVTEKLRPKTTYFEKVGDWLICAGAYK